METVGLFFISMDIPWPRTHTGELRLKLQTIVETIRKSQHSTDITKQLFRSTTMSHGSDVSPKKKFDVTNLHFRSQIDDSSDIIDDIFA